MQRNIIGNRVRRARRQERPPVTQNDLVARLQVLGVKIDQSMISRIEKGSRPVLDFEVVALAEALKLSCQWLLGKSEHLE